MSDRTQISQYSLLRTKLHRPVVPRDFLCRPRLHDLMNLGLDLPLTLVSAPAGYGKSLLVSHWAASQSILCAWLSLDASDSAVDLFVDYLLAAVETVVPGPCPQTSRMAQAPELPPIAVLGNALINELDAMTSPLVLVLDDYHRIRGDSKVRELMRLLLAHPPRHLHLVVVTRRDPPLGLTRLRAQGQLTEVRLKDLRFTPAETLQMLQTSVGKPVSDAAIANLQQEVEGWAVGLRLVFLAMRQAEDPDGFLKQLQGGIWSIHRYLLQEVIQGQPPDMRDCLLRCAILNRFCAGLCDCLSVPDDASQPPRISGKEFIKAVQDRNLFIISLDGRGEWFRYHHLFQDVLGSELKQHLEPGRVAALHQRASQWFETNGYITDAIEHALKAGDPVYAAEILERHRMAELDRDGWRNVEEWLAQLPEEIREQRPALLLAEAAIMHYRFKLEAIAPIVEKVEQLACGETLAPVSLGEWNFWKGVLGYWTGRASQSREMLLEARRLIPLTCSTISGGIELYLALSGHMIGQGEAALQGLENKLRKAHTLHFKYLSNLILGRAFVHVLSGQLGLINDDACWLDKLGRDYGGVFVVGLGRYLKGSYHYRVNEIEATVECLVSAVSQRYSMHTRTVVDMLVVLALAYEALGKGNAATETIETLLGFAEEMPGSHHLAVARSGQARLALAQGDLDRAAKWLSAFDGPPAGPEMLIWLEVPSITKARVLVTMGSPNNLRQAEMLLEALHEVAESGHNICQLMDILALQSLMLCKQGHNEEALSVLGKALHLGEPGGWIRPFVELGPDTADLLRQLAGRSDDHAYIDRILDAFPRRETPAGTAAEPPLPDAGTSAGNTTAEQLTIREQQILELLAERLRDKEIADRLSISAQTVNFHLKNLYRKLGVSSRREAAAKAASG